MIANASISALRTPKSQRSQPVGRAQAHTSTGHFLCARLAHSFACPDRYDQKPNPEDTIQLLHDVRVLVFDFTRSTSQAEVVALSDCQKLLESGDSAEARDLWERLVGIADEKRPAGGSLDSAGLRAELRQRFSLRQHPDFTRDWQALTDLTADYKARVQTALASGQSFARSEEKAKLQTAITTSTITVVFGESGAGKSALLKDLLDERFIDRTQVWLGPDQLKTALSAARRSSLPLDHELGHILNATTNPRNILVLDSAERIEPAEFGVVGRLIQSLLPPEGQTGDATWQIVLVTQTQSWAESAEAIFGGRRARLTEVELLKSSEVKTALLGSPSLAWLVGHDDTIVQLTNLRVLAWVAQAGTALNTSANGLASHTAIADRLWGYWTEQVSTRSGRNTHRVLRRLVVESARGAGRRNRSCKGGDPRYWSNLGSSSRAPHQIVE